MNITFTDRRGSTQRLGNISNGFVVQFRDKFHQNHSTDTPFLVGQTSNTYKPHGYEDKRPVTNLRTGQVSMVDPDRDVWVLRADVSLSY